MVALLYYYKWYKFTIIYEEAWQTVAQSLIQESKKLNMTVNVEIEAHTKLKCCEEKQGCCSSNYWYEFIQDTKNRTRSTLC